VGVVVQHFEGQNAGGDGRVAERVDDIFGARLSAIGDK
jgi:hypothetical protein